MQIDRETLSDGKQRNRNAESRAGTDSQNFGTCHFVSGQPLKDGARDSKHRARCQGGEDFRYPDHKDIDRKFAGSKSPAAIDVTSEKTLTINSTSSPAAVMMTGALPSHRRGRLNAGDCCSL